MLIAFSVYTNGKKLLKVRTSSSELSCLNGIRVLSLIWVIAGHSFSVTATGPVSNALDILTVNIPMLLLLLTNIFVFTLYIVPGYNQKYDICQRCPFSGFISNDHRYASFLRLCQITSS